uniref:Histone H2A/H2B/H3 domain-containing protein n=1 Tax=Meloidogyne floridensis TaxID=298350 RepID=A0A915NUK8_9BILA
MARTKQTAKKSAGFRKEIVAAKAIASKRMRVQLATKRCPRVFPSYKELPPVKMQQKRYHKKGSLALKEIRRFQKSTNLLIPRAPFIRLVRDVANSITGEQYKWRGLALVALQTTTLPSISLR